MFQWWTGCIMLDEIHVCKSEIFLCDAFALWKPCLESQKLWQWGSVGLCDKFLPRVRCNAWMCCRCCWTKKEPELQNWCSPRRRRVRGGMKVFRFSGRFLGTQHRRGTLLHIFKDLCSVLESWKAVPGFTCNVHLLYALGWHLHWKASALVMCTWIEASPHRHDIGIERQVHQAIQLDVNTISNDFRHLRFSCILHLNLLNMWDSLREKSTNMSRCQIQCSIYPALSP